jgi:hypothetical protein
MQSRLPASPIEHIAAWDFSFSRARHSCEHAAKRLRNRGAQKMTNRSVSISLVFFLIMFFWLFTGVEYIAREDRENYELFVKQKATFNLIFENTAMCGECDLRPWKLMKQKARDRFAEYCAARFGLDDTRLCYAIFTEQQRLATESPKHSVLKE